MNVIKKLSGSAYAIGHLNGKSCPQVYEREENEKKPDIFHESVDEYMIWALSMQFKHIKEPYNDYCSE